MLNAITPEAEIEQSENDGVQEAKPKNPCAIIEDDQNQQHANSSSPENESSSPSLAKANSDSNLQNKPLPAPLKPPRLSPQNLGTASISSNDSKPPSYKSNEGENGSINSVDQDDHTLERSNSEETIYSLPWDQLPAGKLAGSMSNKNYLNTQSSKEEDMHSPPKPKQRFSKFAKRLVSYPIQQKAFVVPLTSIVTFLAAYSAIIVPKLKSVPNIKDPLLYGPLIVISSLALLGLILHMHNIINTKIKGTGVKNNAEMFSIMEEKKNNDHKCIKSITLELDDNSKHVLLDPNRCEMSVFSRWPTLTRPIICTEIAAFVTLISTYFLTKHFIKTDKDPDNFFSYLYNNKIECALFGAVATFMLILLVGSIIHYRSKTHVNGLKIDTSPIIYNNAYIKAAESYCSDKGIPLSGDQQQDPILKISEAKIEYYNSKPRIITAA